MKKLRFRCWIDIDGEKVFGPGPSELLQHIDKTGSIAKAAGAMEMSYKKAWDIVERLNKNARNPLVISYQGGKKGGGAEVTKAGHEILKAYDEVTKDMTSVISKHKKLLSLL